MRMAWGLPIMVVVFGCHGCQAPPSEPLPETINAESLMERIRFLSSDDLEGRAPGSPGEEKDDRLLEGEFSFLRPCPRQPRRHVPPASSAGATDQSRATLARPRTRRRDHRARADPRVRRLHRASRGGDPGRRRAGLRWLWRQGSRVRLGRLQGRRPQRQDPTYSGQRPPRPSRARRRRDLRRPGHDVLRPLDLQVPDRRRGTCRGRIRDPPDRTGGLPVGGHFG